MPMIEQRYIERLLNLVVKEDISKFENQPKETEQERAQLAIALIRYHQEKISQLQQALRDEPEKYNLDPALTKLITTMERLPANEMQILRYDALMEYLKSSRTSTDLEKLSKHFYRNDIDIGLTQCKQYTILLSALVVASWFGAVITTCLSAIIATGLCILISTFALPVGLLAFALLPMVLVALSGGINALSMGLISNTEWCEKDLKKHSDLCEAGEGAEKVSFLLHNAEEQNKRTHAFPTQLFGLFATHDIWRNLRKVKPASESQSQVSSPELIIPNQQQSSNNTFFTQYTEEEIFNAATRAYREARDGRALAYLMPTSRRALSQDALEQMIKNFIHDGYLPLHKPDPIPSIQVEEVSDINELLAEYSNLTHPSTLRPQSLCGG